MLLDEAPPSPRPVAIVPIGDMAELPAFQLAEELRRKGHHVEIDFRGKVGQRLKRAVQRNARFAILLGEDELAKGTVVLRDLDRGEQEEIPGEALTARLAVSDAPS
jgi:histidyl-tRNA synthetase